MTHAHPDHGPVAEANAYFAVCQRIHDFVGESVRPIVERNVNVVPGTHVCNGMIARVHGWLRSLGKLNHPGDFQAVLAGSRALFETALDFALITLESAGKFDKLLAWQELEMLRQADKLHQSDPTGNQHPAAEAYRRDHQERIRGLHNKYWEKKGNVPRWTGRGLREDSRIADELGANALASGRFGSTIFSEYYLARYSQACWYTHGSGLVGLLDSPKEYIPIVVALGFRDAARFSLVSSSYALVLVDQYDGIAKARFERLDQILRQDHAEVLRRHRPQR